MNPFLKKITEALARAHVPADVVAEHYPADAPDDAILTFRAETLLLRFTRRAGQEFLEIACALAPGQYHWFSDIEVAMGWCSLERLLSRSEPPPLEEVINRLAQHLAELKKIFFKTVDTFAQTAIQRTMRQTAPLIKPAARRRI
jgi:hypothetical protein